jgi:hypothetical protein
MVMQYDIEIRAVPPVLVGDQIFAGCRSPQTPQLFYRVDCLILVQNKR